MDKDTSLWTWLSLALIAIGSFGYAFYRRESLDTFGTFLLLALAAITGFAALMTWADWMGPRFAYIIQSFRMAYFSADPVLMKLEAFKSLTPAQLAEIGKHLPIITVMGGNQGPVSFLDVGGGERVPMDFAKEFVEMGNDGYLPAIRQWSEGSEDRRLAELMTQYFQGFSIAGEARGNRPAVWLDYQLARRWVGLEE